MNFFTEIPKYVFNKGNEKYVKWGFNNDIPNRLLELYETVPEHSSAIGFILSNIIENDIEQLDYWFLQKLALDYILFGGFAVELSPLRNGTYKYTYLDLSKCRLSPDKKKVGYAENWGAYKADVTWKKNLSKGGESGIFMFKNPISRGDYPTPRYLAATSALDTMSHISAYHNNNAKNGFTPNVVINFNNGEPDNDTKKEIEKQLHEKFTGVNGNKVILSFNEDPDHKTTIEKLESDNLDEKFETLQKFLQNQIIVSHQITSGQLIGIKPENQGFSKSEYSEAMEIFEENVIAGYRREIEYGLTELLGTDIILKNHEILEEEVENDTIDID